VAGTNRVFRAHGESIHGGARERRHVERRPDFLGDDAPVGLEKRHAHPATERAECLVDDGTRLGERDRVLETTTWRLA